MSRFQIIRRTIEAAITFSKVVREIQAVLPPESRERGHEILNETAAKPLFEVVHEESKYFPIDFHYTSLTITMFIKDEESDDELIKCVRSGELEKKLNEIISKLTTDIKIENLRLQEKEVIETSESFEELETKAQNAAYFNPLIVPPSPLKVSCKSL